MHGSLLPKYRGAAPIQRAVLDGETETGVTTMFLADGVDTGDMIQKAVTPIGEEETSGELFDRLAVMGADLLISTVDALARGEVTREVQDHEKATHAAMIRKEEAEIDWTKPATEIHNLVRGMNPWPSAYTFYHGKRMKIHACKVNSLCIAPGEMAEQNGELLIGCGQGSILVEELQPENSRRMAGSAYLRGHPLPRRQIAFLKNRSTKKEVGGQVCRSKMAGEAAMQALLQMEENEGYSNIVFDKTLRGAGLDHREAALAATLFYGVLEKRLVLDWLLQPFCKKPLRKLDLPVRETLRMAVYQIYFLDRVPDSAAVNEAVNWVKQHGYARASGFVNGLLRSLLRWTRHAGAAFCYGHIVAGKIAALWDTGRIAHVLGQKLWPCVSRSDGRFPESESPLIWPGKRNPPDRRRIRAAGRASGHTGPFDSFGARCGMVGRHRQCGGKSPSINRDYFSFRICRPNCVCGYRV